MFSICVMPPTWIALIYLACLLAVAVGDVGAHTRLRRQQRLLPNKVGLDSSSVLGGSMTNSQGAPAGQDLGSVPGTSLGSTLGGAGVLGGSAIGTVSAATAETTGGDGAQPAQLQRLIAQLSQYPAFDPSTAEDNLYERWIDYANREDTFVAGLRVQIRGKQIFYRPAPPEILDSKNPAHKDLFSWWQQTSAHTLAFLSMTLQRHGGMPFVDATFALSDFCRDHDDGNAHTEQMHYNGFSKHYAFFHDQSSFSGGTPRPPLPGVGRRDLAPVFAWNARKECRTVTVPNYDWIHYSENFTEASPYRMDTQPIVPWEKREPIMIWRGEMLAWDGSRARALRLGLLHPEIFNFKTTTPMGAGECGYYHETIQTAGLQAVRPGVLEDCKGIAAGAGPNGTIRMFEQETRKFILDVDGGGSTFRLKNLLLGGWVIFRVQSRHPMEQYFGPDLVPFKHYVPVSLERFETDLIEKFQWALQHDAEAKQIAENARAFAEKEFRNERAEWFQHAALSAYSRWQLPSAESSLAAPSDRRFQRFCCADILAISGWQGFAHSLSSQCQAVNSSGVHERDPLCGHDASPSSWLQPAIAQSLGEGSLPALSSTGPIIPPTAR